MRKARFILGILLSMCFAIIVNSQWHTNNKAHDIILNNIEALADNEYSQYIFCKGEGDEECPKTNKKVELVVKLLSSEY